MGAWETRSERWLLGKHVRRRLERRLAKRLGRLGRQPKQLGASKPVVVQVKPVLAQVRWPRGVCQTFYNISVAY